MLKLLVIAALIVPAAAAAAEEKSDKRERRICKRENVTGSFVAPKRVCLTKEEWEQSLWYNRRNVDEWQNSIDGSRRNG